MSKTRRSPSLGIVTEDWEGSDYATIYFKSLRLRLMAPACTNFPQLRLSRPV